MDWSQSDGEDVYAPAEDVVFTPEIFTLEAGQEQVVRILMPAGSETDAWRIFVDELPATSSGDAPIASQLSMRMQYILPMFAMSPEETPTPIFSLNGVADTNHNVAFRRARRDRHAHAGSPRSGLHPSLINP